MTYEKMLADSLPYNIDVSDNYSVFLEIAFQKAVYFWGPEIAEHLFSYQEDFVSELIAEWQRRVSLFLL